MVVVVCVCVCVHVCWEYGNNLLTLGAAAVITISLTLSHSQASKLCIFNDYLFIKNFFLVFINLFFFIFFWRVRVCVT